MFGLAVNLIANLLGKAWGIVVTLVTVPYYVQLLGREGYGLVTVLNSFAMLQTILDTGLGVELGRRVARSIQNREQNAQELGEFIHTMGILYWLLACGVFTIFAIASPWLAQHLVQRDTLSLEVVSQTFMWMGAWLALQWPIALWNQILINAEHQAIQNAIASANALLRALLAIAGLYWIEASPKVFACMYAISSVAHWMALRFFGRRVLPPLSLLPRFRFDLVKASRSRRIGAFALNSLLLVTGSIDRVLLASLIPLGDLGLYGFAQTIAFNLTHFISPAFTTYLPRFHRSVGAELTETRSVYMQAMRTMFTMVIPASCALITFSQPFIFGWTGNGELARDATPIVRILAIGQSINLAPTLFAALAYASGFFRPLLISTSIAIIAGIAWFSVSHFTHSLTVVAMGWPLMQLINALLPSTPFLKRFVGQGVSRILIKDLIVLLIPTALICLAINPISFPGRVGALIKAALGLVGAFLGTALGVALQPWGRKWIALVRKRISQRFSSHRT
ncbi:MAG: oligosaccharide flippase family protein [Sandaracinaceae bacterium]|nr:oligosaccharide flippase family protein [Sandaracinaceae bacterium]